jgi:hypothetical protein
MKNLVTEYALALKISEEKQEKVVNGGAEVTKTLLLKKKRIQPKLRRLYRYHSKYR